MNVLSHTLCIIGVSETNIRYSNEPITNLSLPGYNLEYMPTSSHCGGVPLFIKYGINNAKRDYPSHSIHNISESIFVELKRGRGKIRIAGCICRHHSAIQDFIETFLQDALAKISSATLIDNIFINNLESCSSGGNTTISSSDHFQLNISDKTKMNQNEFQNDLTGINWTELLVGKTSDEFYTVF